MNLKILSLFLMTSLMTAGSLCKAVDCEIQCGKVVPFLPGGYGWDYYPRYRDCGPTYASRATREEAFRETVGQCRDKGCHAHDGFTKYVEDKEIYLNTNVLPSKACR